MTPHNFAISQFRCTPKAQQILTQSSMDTEPLGLNEDERQILSLTDQYYSPESENKQWLQEAFQELYEKVNLSRLVALNLLTFEVPSSSSANATGIETTSLITQLNNRHARLQDNVKDNSPIATTGKSDFQDQHFNTDQHSNTSNKDFSLEFGKNANQARFILDFRQEHNTTPDSIDPMLQFAAGIDR